MATREKHGRFKLGLGNHHWKSWADGLTLKGISAFISTGARRSKPGLPKPADPSRSRTDREKDLPRSIGKILIVELGGWTDPLLPMWLCSAGYEPEVVQGREAGLDALRSAKPTMLIVKGAADPEFYSALRGASAAPILALAPAADPGQIVAAFGAGVDDFQPDSIEAGEIVARVNALVRRFR